MPFFFATETAGLTVTSKWPPFASIAEVIFSPSCTQSNNCRRFSTNLLPRRSSGKPFGFPWQLIVASSTTRVSSTLMTVNCAVIPSTILRLIGTLCPPSDLNATTRPVVVVSASVTFSPSRTVISGIENVMADPTYLHVTPYWRSDGTSVAAPSSRITAINAAHDPVVPK